MTEQSFDLDLDSLVKESRRIKLNGKTFVIRKPNMFKMLDLMNLSGVLESKKSTDSKKIKAFTEFKKIFLDLCPEIKDEPIDPDQIMALFELMVRMLNNSENKELQKRGITFDNGNNQKKRSE